MSINNASFTVKTDTKPGKLMSRMSMLNGVLNAVMFHNRLKVAETATKVKFKMSNIKMPIPKVEEPPQNATVVDINEHLGKKAKDDDRE